MSYLSDALQKANRNNWSYRRIEQEANKHGYTLSFTTVGKYMRGNHPEKPGLDVIQAFAAALGVSENELLKAAGNPELKDPFVLPEEAAALDRRERESVLNMIDVIIRAKQLRRMPGTAGREYEDAAATQLPSRLHPELDNLDAAAYENADPEWKHRRAAERARGEETQETPYDGA
ncbi:hypothetical protein [Kocuria sp. HSID16901]|uniref:hypothetical protein n=1 Tax=Kocuria sp. HSID16901 TaxID=2419505 RepID=UPI0006602E0F|nr:hypothetical protein [Kocuria sp. HSID16901]MCT1367210.1 hypothetical protein [Rothia sp. p3-SID1597]RUQ23489.1 hypothetical protein D8M21_01960 [Kocuria sp. HSID16901]